jgi:hypothetical protein
MKTDSVHVVTQAGSERACRLPSTTKISANHDEDDIDCVAVYAPGMVSLQLAIALLPADHRLEGTSLSHVTSDCWRNNVAGAGGDHTEPRTLEPVAVFNSIAINPPTAQPEGGKPSGGGGEDKRSCPSYRGIACRSASSLADWPCSWSSTIATSKRWENFMDRLKLIQVHDSHFDMQ